MTTKFEKGRGRPRKFDEEQALATAQAMFHAHGYDAVSVADLTQALGIKPPSFYAAFGCKAQLFERVLARYAGVDRFGMADLLQEGRPVAEALADLLKAIAVYFTENRDGPGCMVLEAARAHDPAARAAAEPLKGCTVEAVRAFVAKTHPDAAERIASFLSVVLAGLSNEARSGMDRPALEEAARLAARAIARELEAPSSGGSQPVLPRA